jgi:hypothetical protein
MDLSKLEGIQRKFAALCYSTFLMVYVALNIKAY